MNIYNALKLPSITKHSSTTSGTATGTNMGADFQTQGAAAATTVKASRPIDLHAYWPSAGQDALFTNAHVLAQPCCVCKDEKAARDECMLFSTGDEPEKTCRTTIERYRSCMAGYGFKLP